MKVYPSRQDLCVCVKRGALAIVSCLQNTYYCTQNLNDNPGYKRPCVGKLEWQTENPAYKLFKA